MGFLQADILDTGEGYSLYILPSLGSLESAKYATDLHNISSVLPLYVSSGDILLLPLEYQRIK